MHRYKCNHTGSPDYNSSVDCPSCNMQTIAWYVSEAEDHYMQGHWAESKAAAQIAMMFVNIVNMSERRAEVW